MNSRMRLWCSSLNSIYPLMYRNSSGNRCLSSRKRSMKLNTKSSLPIHPKKWCKERSSNLELNSNKPINSYNNSSRWWCLEEVKLKQVCRVAPSSICLQNDHGSKTISEICPATTTTVWITIPEERAERQLSLILILPSKEVPPHKMKCPIILVSIQEVDLGRRGIEIWRAV